MRPPFVCHLSSFILAPAAFVLATCSGGRTGDTSTDGASKECSAASGADLARCVDAARFEADLATIAKARPSGSAHWKVVQDLCAERFAALGCQVERHAYGTGVNVVGTLAGGGAHADEKVLLSAHYDSVSGCAGADDNGSGVAGVLEGARVLAAGRYDRTLVVACWDQEEDGLVGSAAWVRRAKNASVKIAGVLVLEMIGYRSDRPDSQRLPAGFEYVFPDQVAQVRANGARGDFITFVGDTGAASLQTAFLAQAAGDGLPTVSLMLPDSQKNSDTFGDLRRSDHAPFWMADYPAAMLTDTANFRNDHYHCAGGPDAPADLDPAFAAKVVRASVASAAALLGPR